MSRYQYRAVDPKGAEVIGQIAADTLEAAERLLRKKRLAVLSLEQTTALAPAKADAHDAARSGPFNLFAQKLSAKQHGLFTRQLATLVSVMPLEEALGTLVEQSEADNQRSILERIHQRVVEGFKLSAALTSEPKSFSPLYISMVAAGESSGALTKVLNNLADLADRQAEVRSKLTAALAYPAALAAVALAVVIAMMTLVVPRLVEQFDTIGQTLPFLTRAVIAVSNLLVNYGWLMALVIVVGVLAFARSLRNEGFRERVDAALLRVPVIGTVLRRTAAARLARTLSVMLESGMPLVDGLAATAKTVGNRRIRAAYTKVMVDIREGSTVSTALKRTQICPPILVHMAASGEQSGKLAELLARAGETLEREFDSASATVLGLLEPAIIVVMGGLVTLIVMAILLPILQLNVLAIG
ncbi:MAG: type II secretion system inner membrane protein GspF [Pseudomonadota bacterium]